jgi:hypothetical protein
VGVWFLLATLFSLMAGEWEGSAGSLVGTKKEEAWLGLLLLFWLNEVLCVARAINEVASASYGAALWGFFAFTFFESGLFSGTGFFGQDILHASHLGGPLGFEFFGFFGLLFAEVVLFGAVFGEVVEGPGVAFGGD